MICPCHGIEMGWQKDRRLKAGGAWECREKRRIYNKTRNKQRVAWVEARRDSDPLYRIASQLSDRRNKGLKRIAARHLPREDDQAYGPLQEQRLHGPELEPHQTQDHP